MEHLDKLNTDFPYTRYLLEQVRKYTYIYTITYQPILNQGRTLLAD